MSFGGQSTSAGLTLKKFESAGEVEERKKILQEQWEKVRKPDDPLERPEDDGRSLFEKLQEQKDRKQQEYEDQFKFGNAVKGLEKDEAEFLDQVSQRQMEIEKERLSEETSILREMRDANVTKKEAEKASSKEPEKSTSKPSVSSSSSRKSQQSLLMGAVKRKGSDTQVDAKKSKTEDVDSSTGSDPTEKTNSGEASPEKPGTVQSGAVSSSVNGVARVIGILPGIGNYSDDSSDSNSSNSSCEWDELLTAPKVKRIIITSKEC